MPRLREQDRAQEALKAVRGRLNQPKAKEYRQEAQQLPSRIQACGLGQTLAFYASKRDEDPYHTLGETLARRLGEAATTVDYLERIMAGDAATYRRETREALAFAEWLKRYAKALIPD